MAQPAKGARYLIVITSYSIHYTKLYDRLLKEGRYLSGILIEPSLVFSYNFV